MNYIKRMQEEVAEANAKLAAAEEELTAFMTFLLTSPKFNGTENGERKDWISTRDVVTRLEEIRSMVR